MKSLLMGRDDFREAVFARDGHKCVFCSLPALDAHHILERRLWPDGGYYLDNGISVCEEHHLACEMTLITVEQAREAAGIVRRAVPPDLYDDERYDKWGNILTLRGRLPGPLFDDPSVQKILKQGGVLGEFTHYVKYPRTPHLPWSSGTSDDRVLSDVTCFQGHEVVVTVKMDGENTSLYRDYIHARSLDGRTRPGRSWVKNFWSSIKHEIPEGWRICGENLYARHTIAYTDLPEYFLGFSVWDNPTSCVDWDTTLEWFDLLGLKPVPEIFRGEFDEKLIRRLEDQLTGQEGLVVRKTCAFKLMDFQKSVAKFVRPGFKPENHRVMQAIEINGRVTHEA